MSKLGRKPNSSIRKNLVEILFFLKEAYGYQLYKIYSYVFEKKISIRSIYYNLTKGVELGVFKIKDVQEASGDYSWGNNVQRIIFSLGKEAHPEGSEKIYERICAMRNENKMKNKKRY